jgi:hypothetical protein
MASRGYSAEGGDSSAGHVQHDDGPPRFPAGADNWRAIGGPGDHLPRRWRRLRCRMCVNAIGTIDKVGQAMTSPNARVTSSRDTHRIRDCGGTEPLGLQFVHPGRVDRRKRIAEELEKVLKAGGPDRGRKLCRLHLEGLRPFCPGEEGRRIEAGAESWRGHSEP